MDKVLQHHELQPRELAVDHSTLLSLQSLAQWVTDLTLYLLATLPQGQGNRLPGVSSLLGSKQAARARSRYFV